MESSIVAPRVLVVDDDLFFAVRIETTLKKLGYDVRVVGNADAAVGLAQERTPALAIVNFGSTRLPATEVVERLKALHDAPLVLGFVPHKQMPFVRQNAMAAGCDRLIANSALSMRLPQIIARLVPLDGSAASLPDESEYAHDEEGDTH